jgi:hypothetical protein
VRCAAGCAGPAHVTPQSRTQHWPKGARAARPSDAPMTPLSLDRPAAPPTHLPGAARPRHRCRREGCGHARRLGAARPAHRAPHRPPPPQLRAPDGGPHGGRLHHAAVHPLRAQPRRRAKARLGDPQVGRGGGAARGPVPSRPLFNDVPCAITCPVRASAFLPSQRPTRCGAPFAPRLHAPARNARTRPANPPRRIEIGGLVERPMSISMDELLSMPSVTLPVTLVCAGNRRKEENMIKKSIGFNWGPCAVSTAHWTGAPLAGSSTVPALSRLPTVAASAPLALPQMPQPRAGSRGHLLVPAPPSRPPAPRPPALGTPQACASATCCGTLASAQAAARAMCLSGGPSGSCPRCGPSQATGASPATHCFEGFPRACWHLPGFALGGLPAPVLKRPACAAALPAGQRRLLWHQPAPAVRPGRQQRRARRVQAERCGAFDRALPAFSIPQSPRFSPPQKWGCAPRLLTPLSAACPAAPVPARRPLADARPWLPRAHGHPGLHRRAHGQVAVRDHRHRGGGRGGPSP